MVRFPNWLVLLKFEHFRNLPGKQSVHLNPSLIHLQLIHLPLALHQQQLGIMYIEKLEEVEIKIAVKRPITPFLFLDQFNVLHVPNYLYSEMNKITVKMMTIHEILILLLIILCTNVIYRVSCSM